MKGIKETFKKIGDKLNESKSTQDIGSISAAIMSVLTNTEAKIKEVRYLL